MSLEGPKFEIPDGNLKSPEAPLIETPETQPDQSSETIELSPEDREMAERIADTLVQEADITEELAAQNIDEGELSGINKEVHSGEKSMEESADSRFSLSLIRRRQGFMSATVAAGIIAAMSLMAPSEAGAQSRRTAQRAGEIVKVGGEIYGDFKDREQKDLRDSLRETQREISRVERDLRSLGKQIDKAPEAGSRVEEKALQDSEKYTEKVAELKLKAQKARNAGHETIADSYEKLAERYQAEAAEKMSVSIDTDAQLHDLDQGRQELESRLTTLRGQERDIRRRLSGSELKEKVVKRGTRRVPRILRY